MMDGRSVLLVSIPRVDEKFKHVDDKSDHLKIVVVSSDLRLALFYIDNTLSLFSLAKQSDFEHKGAHQIWSESVSQISSITFSDDGKHFAVLSCQSLTQKLILFKLNDNAVSKESESLIFELGKLEGTTGSLNQNDNVCDSSYDNNKLDTILQLKKHNVVIYSCGYLSNFHITTTNELNQKYLVGLTPDAMCYYYNIQFFFYLDCSGIVYVYLLENGSLMGIYDVFKTLPRSLCFNKMCAAMDGTHLALLGNTNQIYILNITLSSAPLILPSFVQSSVPDSSSGSSMKTSTSTMSSYSRADSSKKEKTNKKIESVASASIVSSFWKTYIDKLRARKTFAAGTEEECTSFICIQDIPNTYMVQSLHFCQDSLAIWATHYDETSEGIYRLYDSSTGHLESADLLASDTKVIPFDTPKVSIDLFLQDFNLCLPLGIISRDKLVQKLVGGENECRVGEMIGQAVLPLPLLNEGLCSLQIDMVRLALNLHTQGVKLNLTETKDEVEYFAKPVTQLFKTILSALDEQCSNNQWCLQIRRLALTHANTLLSLLQSTDAHISVQIEILNYIVLLRRGEAISVDIPDIPQWTSWLTLSDEEVILFSIDSFPLVRCFLILHRNWTEEDFEGQRFFNSVNRVFINLLKKEKLEEAVLLLNKLGLDPKKELDNLSLICQDLQLRNFLFNNLKDSLQVECFNAWKYLTLLEAILNSYEQFFSAVTLKSPLKIYM